MDEILFYAFGAVALVAALLSVSRKNAVAAACWLVVMFFGLAGVFILLEAYFVAVIQILVYAGAIMVLFLFVIMLLDLKREDLLAHGGPRLKFAGIALSAAFLAIVWTVLASARDGDGVADRVTASLRLPAPPAPTVTDPLKVSAAPSAPPAVPVLLAEVPPADLQLDAATRGWFRTEHARARTGTVEIPPLSAASPSPGGSASPGSKGRGVLAAVDRSETVHVWLDADGDGTFSAAEALVVPPPPGEPPGKIGSADRVSLDLAVPGAAPGTVLEIVHTRRGLATSSDGGPDGSPLGVGKALYDVWILPFEVTSVLLLGAIFGAVVLTKRKLA